MSDLHLRSESVDVEQIMRQIRARIREKRGADYTEDEIKELAAVKLERFLDPLAVRSGLLDDEEPSGAVVSGGDLRGIHESRSDLSRVNLRS